MRCVCAQNHWFTYNERMSVESVTQAVSNLALQFGDDDADPGAMVRLRPSGRHAGAVSENPNAMTLKITSVVPMIDCSRSSVGFSK